jgi:hypothetical protein
VSPYRNEGMKRRFRISYLFSEGLFMNTLRAATLLISLLGACAASAATLDRRGAPVLIAELRQGGSTIRFEQVDNKAIVLTEISDPFDAGASVPIVAKLMEDAKSKSIRLCPAHVFGLLSTQPIPSSLWQACKDPKALEQLQTLRAQAKYTSIDVRPITTIGSYCVGATGYQSFRTQECSAMETRLGGLFLVEDDSTFWCANTLKKDSDRSMSSMLDEEGERASIAAVSCTGNTRFRFYMRDSTGDSWSLLRDYQLGPSQRIALYAYDDDSWGDSDFRFRLNSGDGAWHRSTGFFLDE